MNDVLRLQILSLPKRVVYVCARSDHWACRRYLSEIGRQDVWLVSPDQLGYGTLRGLDHADVTVALGVTLTPAQHQEIFESIRQRYVDPRWDEVNSYELTLRHRDCRSVANGRYRSMKDVADRLAWLGSEWTWEVRSSSVPMPAPATFTPVLHSYWLVGQTASGQGERREEFLTLKDAVDRMNRELDTGHTYREWSITSSDYRENRA